MNVWWSSVFIGGGDGVSGGDTCDVSSCRALYLFVGHIA